MPETGEFRTVEFDEFDVRWEAALTRLMMSLHPVAIELLREVGLMAVSSADVSGQPAAATVQEARDQLGDSVSVYCDGGPSGDPVPSTIVDLSGGEPVVLLREGAVSVAAISEALGEEVGTR